MKKNSIHLSIILITVLNLFCTSCNKKESIDITTEENVKILKSFLQGDDSKSLDAKEGTVFYADASAVLLDAMKNSSVYDAMKGQISQYVTDLVFIEGDNFDTIKCDRSEQTLFNALSLRAKKKQTLHADILKSIENICEGDRQGMIITDFEQQKNGNWMDCNPYLSEQFKNWLQKGYQIDFIIEPYNEGKDLKKRFYVFFTDPTDNVSINHTMINQVQKFIDDTTCVLLSVNAKDYRMDCSDEENSSSSEISIEMADFKSPNVYSCVINDSWDDIKENLMKLDRHDQPIEEETPKPLIDNLKIVDGSTYCINNIVLKATNISKPFMMKIDSSLEMNNPDEIYDISDAFDIKITKGKKIEVYVNKNILNERHLFSTNDGFVGNLIKLEFVVSDNGFTTKSYDFSQLEWVSARPGTKGKTANCVSLSLNNALTDVNVVPSAPQNRVLYTIFIQTESFK